MTKVSKSTKITVTKTESVYVEIRRTVSTDQFTVPEEQTEEGEKDVLLIDRPLIEKVVPKDSNQ